MYAQEKYPGRLIARSQSGFSCACGFIIFLNETTNHYAMNAYLWFDSN